MAKIGLECTKDGLEHAERVAESIEIADNSAKILGTEVVNSSGKVPNASISPTQLPTGSGGVPQSYNLQQLATYLYSKDIIGVSIGTEQGNLGKLVLSKQNGTMIVSDIYLTPTLPTGSGGANVRYTLQKLATYLYGKQIAGVSVNDGGVNDGKLMFTFNDGSTYLSDVNLKPRLPTGPGGNNQIYTLQDLATYLYTQLGTKANSAEVFPQSPTGYQSAPYLEVCNIVFLDNIQETPTFAEFAQTCVDCISTKMIVHTTELFLKTNAESNPQQLQIGLFSTVEALIPETGDDYILFVQGTVTMGDTTYCGNVMIQENANHEFVISHGGDYDNGTFDYVAKQSDITAAVGDIETALQGLISGGGVV